MDEVIFFSTPTDESHLLVVNVSNSWVGDDLFRLFAPFGLVNEATFYRSDTWEPRYPDHDRFAFVRYYSVSAALAARKALHNKRFQGVPLRVVPYKRKKSGHANQERVIPLPFHKCVELANYYIGFNHWSYKVEWAQQYSPAKEMHRRLLNEHPRAQQLQRMIEEYDKEQKESKAKGKVSRAPNFAIFVCEICFNICGTEFLARGIGYEKERPYVECLGAAKKKVVSVACHTAFQNIAIVRLKSGKIGIQLIQPKPRDLDQQESETLKT